MRKLLFLVAATALSVACHSRSDEEVGAAPDEGTTGDTTAVTHAIDSTRTGPPGVGGRPGDATVTPDSLRVDTTATQGGIDTTAQDTTTMGQDTSLTSTPQDTLGPGNPYEGGAGDTTLQGDTTGMQSDTSWSDTTSSNQ